MKQTNYHHFKEIDSTNDWAKQHLADFDPQELTVIRAEAQTQGRGRFGRKWFSPKEVNLYLTYVFFIKEDVDTLRLTHLLALAVKECLTDVVCQIKWPNDIYCEGKKLGGILCETQSHHSLQAVIIGLGLNVNLAAVTSIDQPATSLLLQTGLFHSIDKSEKQITEMFQRYLKRYLSAGFHDFIAAFTQALIPTNPAQPVKRDVLLRS